MSNGTNITFGNNAKIDTLATGENAVVDKSQGKTIVHGDMHGDIHNEFGDAPDLDPSQFIAALRHMYHVEAAKVDGDEPDAPMSDDEALEQALDNATLAEDRPPRLAAPRLSALTASADQVFTDLTQAVSDPDPAPAQVESSLGAFKNLVLAKGPVFGLALCNAAKAWAKTQIMQHPIASAAYAFLETFTGPSAEAPQ
jgi:hypothetical protein